MLYFYWYLFSFFLIWEGITESEKRKVWGWVKIFWIIWRTASTVGLYQTEPRWCSLFWPPISCFWQCCYLLNKVCILQVSPLKYTWLCIYIFSSCSVCSVHHHLQFISKTKNSDFISSSSPFPSPNTTLKYHQHHQKQEKHKKKLKK